MAPRPADDRSIIITGCSSGIGRDAALSLHERGYSVVATVRAKSDGAELEREGINVIEMHMDDPESVEHGFRAALEMLDGRLYGIFNNAGFGIPGAVEDLSVEALHAQMRTNLYGVLQLSTLALPVMLKAGRGRIIQNSSVLGLAALPYRGAYVASKYALEGLSDTLRLELRGTGVFVSLIEPGPVSTLFRANSLRAFNRYIDTSGSRHQRGYAHLTARLSSPKDSSRTTVPASSVTRRLIHALESRRPRARYYVTVNTHVVALARRLLPVRLMDRLLSAGS